MRSHLALVNLDSVDRAPVPGRRTSRAGQLAAVIWASWLAACGADNPPLFSDLGQPTTEEVIPPLEPMRPPVDEEPQIVPPPPTTREDSGEGSNAEVPLDGDEGDNAGGGDGDDVDGDDGEQQPADDTDNGEPEPPPPIGPSVISVFPEDGATAVSADAVIVIRFSSPMNEEATERAYQSELIPSSAVTFSWNEDSTALTVTPNEPLEYDTGTDPAQVEARRYSFFLSGSAEDIDGNELEQPEEFSFSLLRQIEVRFSAVQDPDLTGNWRSDNTYGTGDCGRNAANICVGDQRTGGNNRQYKGFVTFDLSDLPAEAVAISGARLNLQITGMAGNPFSGNSGLGDLLVEHAAFDVIGAQAFGAPAVATLGTIADSDNQGPELSLDVLPAVEQDASERLATQYRFAFGRATDDDFNNDAILSAWETQTLDVFFLLP